MPGINVNVLFCCQPNVHTYVVIGGCHQLAAVKELHEEDPGNEHYKDRNLQVYSKELLNNATAVSWLANKHNEIQGMHLKMTTEAKVNKYMSDNAVRGIYPNLIAKFQNCFI